MTFKVLKGTWTQEVSQWVRFRLQLVALQEASSVTPKFVMSILTSDPGLARECQQPQKQDPAVTYMSVTGCCPD